jgi:hypothetical protein
MPKRVYIETTSRMSMVNEKETTDEVVEEVRRIKEKLAKSFDFDVDRILEDARRRQKQSRRTVLPPPVPHGA